MLSLTATELNRFMKCNGSRLLGGITPIDRDNTVADEGNAVHWLVEEVFKENFKAEELIDRKAPNGVFITGDMISDSEKYLDDIAGKGCVEMVTSYSHANVYEVRGRADHIFYDSENLYISDFKYGWKIVEPDENWTLISHAYGWLLEFGAVISAPKNIIFRIYQPRPYHPDGVVREWSISYEQFLKYAEQLVQTLSVPSDGIITGSHCYKCPSMSQCPASQIAVMNSIDVAQMAFNSEVDNKQLSFIMDEIARAKTVLSEAEDAFKDLAMVRIKAGGNVPEYCLETSLGNNDWKEGMTAEIVQAMTGIDVSKKKLLTPNQAKKAGVSEEILETLTARENKGFKLVRVDGSKKAEKLFGRR